MRPLSLQYLIGSALVVTFLTACGGGGSGSSDGQDVYPGSRGGVTATSGPDSFLLFPNPQIQTDMVTKDVDSAEYAAAYYRAIDPNNDRDTLAKFKSHNHFGDTSGGNIEETVIVGDQRDLGYGRKLTARQNADGTLAFVVENYLVGAYGGYNSLNLEAAVNAEAKWHIGTNGIEFSPGPGGTVKFVKFYTFDPITGARLTAANLDGRGNKAMPTICISCHGGRGDPLTPANGSGHKLFPRLMNAASKVDVIAPDVGGMRGDIGAQLHPLEPASFDFSSTSGFTRANLEAKMKTINKMVLCSFPLAGASGGAEDTCRRAAIQDEYQGTAAAHLKDMYGGDGLPQATASTTDTYVPTSWSSVGQSDLYLKTQAKSCRVCHLLRGTGNQSDIDFETFAKFQGYADRIKAHVVDRGNMPLAKLIYDKYWSDSTIYSPMATFLLAEGYTDGASKPGRPIADPGPDRVVKSTSIPLSASMSLYSTTYQWTVISGAGAALTNATSSTPTLTVPGSGTYVVQLVTGNGSTSSTAKQLTVVVNTALGYDPTALRFTDIATILRAGGGGCTTCHTAGGSGGVIPPIWYTNTVDRNADSAVDAIDEHWLYTELRGRINFTDIVASPLLRKPSGKHHNGGLRTGFDTSAVPGDAARVDYDKILGWILNGAPEN
jgi:mono/diheme cytochrome c family protein